MTDGSNFKAVYGTNSHIVIVGLYAAETIFVG
jgi:hypothetical protein